MKESDFAGIVQGLREVQQYVETGVVPAGAVCHPVTVDEVDVRALRSRMSLSRPGFAKKFGFELRAIQDWEQGRSCPDKAMRAYLRVIERDPDAVLRALSSD